MITYLDRYEKKFFINYIQENNIKKKITKIFERDTFCKNGSYFCLSIYFDDNYKLKITLYETPRNFVEYSG